jgi:hypothetical protein
MAIYSGNSARQLTGYALARNGRTASQRAALAASIIAGEIDFVKPTKKQIAQLLGVSVVYVSRAEALNRFQRDLVCKGYASLSTFHTLTQSQLERVVEEAGVARTWEALEPLI